MTLAKSKYDLYFYQIARSTYCSTVVVFFSKTMKNLLNQADKYGCTPLHYASMEGHVTTINALLTLGASLTARSHQKQSALHFAAR